VTRGTGGTPGRLGPPGPPGTGWSRGTGGSPGTAQRRARYAAVLALAALTATTLTASTAPAHAAGSGSPAGSGNGNGTAAAPGSLESQATTLQGQLGSISAHLAGDRHTTAAAQARYDLAAGALPAARAALLTAQGEADGAAVLSLQAQRDVTAAQQRVVLATAAAARAQVQVQQRLAATSSSVATAYMEGPVPALSTWLGATDLAAIADRGVTLGHVGARLHASVLAVDAARSALAQDEAQAGVALGQVRAAQVAAGVAQVRAVQAAALAAQRGAAVTALVRQRSGALASAQDAEAGDAGQVAALQAQSDRIQALLAARPRTPPPAPKPVPTATTAAPAATTAAPAATTAAPGPTTTAAATTTATPITPTTPTTTPTTPTTTPTTPTATLSPPTAPPPPAPAQMVAASGLLWPASGPVTSGFGYRVDPVTNIRQLHAGVDIGAPTGAPISAAQAGTVAFTGTVEGYGNYTCIDHGDGFATCYAHQSSILVTEGQVVARGQKIGLVGTTGWVTGPHLHFETRVDGVPVDPMQYF